LISYKEKKGGSKAISELGLLLNKDPIGTILLSEHKIFEGFTLALFNSNASKHGIEHVLKEIKGNGIDAKIL
jgi:hypothetical protein